MIKRIQQREFNMGESTETKELTKAEYVREVQTGAALHVFNTETERVEVIQRDGYYSPQTMKKLVNIEGF
jgi:hypothetical protein